MNARLRIVVLFIACLSAGLSFKTTMGNVLTLTPPLTITEAEMTQALDIIETALAGTPPR